MIDVNTGSFTGRGKGRLEDTITKVNVEAAEEVVRQLRMRDIGGIIVIDFIDMARPRTATMVLKTLRTALDEDRTKTYVVEVSPLGLVEMTRQNVTDGVREILTKRCPTCDGEVWCPPRRRSRSRSSASCARWSRRSEAGGLLIRVNPRVAAEPCDADSARGARGRRPASGSTSRAARRCRSTPSRSSSRRQRGDRGAGAAVPGRRRGPGHDRGTHMYNVDDAVARVESYMVSVTGAGPQVGERGWSGSRASGARRRPRRCSDERGTPRPWSGDGASIRPPAGQGRGSGGGAAYAGGAGSGNRRQATHGTQWSRPAASSTASRRARPCSSIASRRGRGGQGRAPPVAFRDKEMVLRQGPREGQGRGQGGRSRARRTRSGSSSTGRRRATAARRATAPSSPGSRSPT